MYHLHCAAISLITAISLSGHPGLAAPAYTDDRWNPAHYNSLSAPLRARLREVSLLCGPPLEAEHHIATYIQANGAEYAILHFEHLRCQNRTVLCRDARCLHEVYKLNGNTSRRLLQAVVIELRLSKIDERAVLEVDCGPQVCDSILLP